MRFGWRKKWKMWRIKLTYDELYLLFRTFQDILTNRMCIVCGVCSGTEHKYHILWYRQIDSSFAYVGASANGKLFLHKFQVKCINWYLKIVSIEHTSFMNTKSFGYESLIFNPCKFSEIRDDSAEKKVIEVKTLV